MLGRQGHARAVVVVVRAHFDLISSRGWKKPLKLTIATWLWITCSFLFYALKTSGTKRRNAGQASHETWYPGGDAG
jgi:hypothetical protein